MIFYLFIGICILFVSLSYTSTMENNAPIVRAEFSCGKLYEDCKIMKSGTCPEFFRKLFL